ncbi:MAG: amidohydrolase family protein [Gemmatimonadetes bacterium]|jgi:imidazolonepropionase-like amidohydrolase|nr:amidohydrolase family protein [Gemmatimonadota bacterium]
MTTRRSLPALALALLVSCASPDSQGVAYVGATVWDGTGSAPVPGVTIVVDSGRITAISTGSAPSGTQVVSLEGKFVIPGLIDVHAHVSGRWAPEGVTGEADRIRGDLELFAKYGVTTVNSLGDGEAAIAVRDAASPTDPRARLLASGAVVAGDEAAAVRAAAISRADAGVDWLKLRVDDNLGSSQKMPWDAVQAVLDVGEERGLRVATHLFYLDDAKRLLEMGTGMVAHSVRDTDVDDSFINALITNDVCYVPTLTREISTFVYAERPGFFDNDFFTELSDQREIARVSEPAFMERMRESPAAAGYRVALQQALRNLKTLVDAGAPVTFGTDAGPAARFPGFFEHLELAVMVRAGIRPDQALYAATGQAAACLGLEDVGTLEVGNWADFLVLASSPMDDITNTQTLEQVYVAGKPLR